MNIEIYIPIARGLVALMNPLVEVVIHELRTGTIAFIEGGLSKRKVGDASLLDIDGGNWEGQLDEKLYPKLEFDGRLIKSVSVPIKENDDTVALMCINYDVSLFKEIQHITDVILKSTENEKPAFLFKNDWQERIHEFTHKYLVTNGLSFKTLTPKDKKELVHLLYTEGAFNEKHAAEYIAKVLDMGRATVFNYLKKWRNENEA